MFDRARFILFSFNGRINRRQFWLGVLGWVSILSIGSAIAAAFDQMLGTPAVYHSDTANADLGPIWLLVMVVLFFCSCAVPVKRLHDRDRAALWMAASIVPLINLWLLIDLGFLGGTADKNEWGPAPVVGRARPVVGQLTSIGRGNIVDRLSEIQRLKDAGSITAEEFASLKQAVFEREGLSTATLSSAPTAKRSDDISVDASLRI